MAAVIPAQVQLTDDAWVRTRNWQASMPDQSAGIFERFNSTPKIDEAEQQLHRTAHSFYRQQREGGPGAAGCHEA